MRNVDFDVSNENSEMIRNFRKKMKLRMSKLIPYCVRFASVHPEFADWIKEWEEGM